MAVSEAPRSARAALERRRAQGGRGLIPFLTAGFPDWDGFDAAVEVLASSGADVLEIGLPFSDPLADGPTIQASSFRALQSGVTVASVLDRIEARRDAWRLPLILMTYVNPLLAFGAERFARRAAEAGVAGVLISDLPPEELPEVWSALVRAGLERIVLTAPTTDPKRIPLLARTASGFVYCVTRTGVTGKGSGFAENLERQVARVRAETPLPVVAGFGIRTARDVGELARFVDGVVIGARLIEILSENDAPRARKELRELTASLRHALDNT